MLLRYPKTFAAVVLATLITIFAGATPAKADTTNDYTLRYVHVLGPEGVQVALMSEDGNAHIDAIGSVIYRTITIQHDSFCNSPDHFLFNCRYPRAVFPTLALYKDKSYRFVCYYPSGRSVAILFKVPDAVNIRAGMCPIKPPPHP